METDGIPPAGAPIEYPAVLIDGNSYQVKFSQAALYRLDKMGVDLKAFSEDLKRQKDSGEPIRLRISMVYDMLSACIQKVRFNPEELADMIPMAVAVRTLSEAMGKALPSATAPGATEATEAQPPVQ